MTTNPLMAAHNAREDRRLVLAFVGRGLLILFLVFAFLAVPLIGSL